MAIDAGADLDNGTNAAFFTLNSDTVTAGGQSGKNSGTAWQNELSGDDF